MSEPIQLVKVLEQSRLSGSCDNCGFGIRHTDGTGLRRWCKRCIDVWIRKGKLIPARAEKTILALVGPKYADANFENFKGKDKVTKDRLLKLKHDEDVFIFGQVGTGKTYAMAALLRHYVYEGYTCERINFDDFCVQVRATYTSEEVSEYDLIRHYRDADKLWIDDLGLRSKQESDHAYITLYTLINKRQESRLPTYICSNKNINQLGKSFDARIASRLSTAVIIETTGKDRREKYQIETNQRGQKVSK